MVYALVFDARVLEAVVGATDSMRHRVPQLQPFSQEPRTPTVAPLLRIGLYDPLQADL